MKPLVMPTLTVTVKGRLGRKRKHTLEGGWSSQRPVATLTALDQATLARFYLDDYGGDLPKAHAHAETMFEEWLDARWRESLGQFTRYWLKVYIGRYGDSNGFKPETVAGYYVPGENPGRGGRRGLQRELRRMR